MRQLAVEGGKPLVRTPIRPLVSIGREEVQAVGKFMAHAAAGKTNLSGYLAGSERGGMAVQRLEAAWCAEFGCKYAIACNSGTSALLTAYWAAEVTGLVMPTMAMSAIAAAAFVLNLPITLIDVDSKFAIMANYERNTSGIVSVNLFGQPLRLAGKRYWKYWIADNAQAAWATFDDNYTGSLGEDICCWSLNVHKPNNAGEGGICTTNDDEFALRMRHFINHGETNSLDVGLNLRMPELTAVLALAQLPRAKRIVQRRQEIAHRLGAQERPGCQSSWYCFPFLVDNRDWVVKALIAEGVPARAGYTLIHRLPAFAGLADQAAMVNAERMEARLVLLELCSIEPSDTQVEQMRAAIEQITRIAHGS